jgi:plastocyanin
VKCTQAEFDDTSGGDGGDFTKFPGVDVSFFDAAPKQYVNHCAKTKVGDTVTFAGDFTIHPLVPLGGDTPSFIKATSTGSTVEFVPTTPGTYGFACSAHPGIMFGAIQVVAK